MSSDGIYWGHYAHAMCDWCLNHDRCHVYRLQLSDPKQYICRDCIDHMLEQEKEAQRMASLL